MHTVYDYYILDNLLEGCQIIDFDWRYCYLNESAARHAHCPKETLLGSTMMERYPGVETTALFAMLQRCMVERTMANLENEFFYPDGSSAWFELKALPVPTGLMIFSVDITVRKQAEVTERESAEWARLALNASNLGKWQHDLVTNLIRVDEQARQHYGFAQHTVTLAMVLKQLHPEDLPRVELEMASLLDPANNGRYVTEYRVLQPDGSVHWLAIQAQVYFRGEGAERRPYLGFGTSQEISARKAAEEALKQHTQRLEILHEIDLGIINATSIAEIMTGALKQIRRLFGCEQASALLFDLAKDEVLILAMESTSPSLIKEGERYPMSPGFLESFAAQQISVIDDLATLPSTNNAYRRVRQDGMRSSLRALFSYYGGPLGMLVLNAATPHYFTAEAQTMAAQIASQLAVALQQRQLVDDLAHYVVAVEEMQQFLHSILDAFPANLAVLAPDGVIITVNQRWKAFAAANGAPPDDDYLGVNYLTICDMAVGPTATEAAATATGIRAVIAGEQEEFSFEYHCSSSSECWFILRVTPLLEAAPRRVIVAHIDITERKSVEKAEREQRLLAEALRDSLAALTTSVDTETTLQQILAYSATVIPSEAGAILLYEGEQGRVAYLRGHSAEAEAFFQANPVLLDTGIYAWGVDGPGYYIVTDTTTEPGWRTFPVTAWVRSSLAVQISVRGKPIGLLIVDSANVGQFQPKDVMHLQTFARYAALALEKAHYVNQLEELVQVRTAQLQAAKERVEAILDNSADAILLIATDLRIHQANASFYRLLGNQSAALVNQTMHDFISASDVKAITQLIQQVIKEAKTGRLEFHAQRFDGAIFDAELSIGLINDDGLVCIMRDITQRKVQERRLQYHAGLQKAVGDPVIVTDMAWQIQSWNNAAERVYGWSADEVIGRVVNEVVQTQFASSDDLLQSIALLHKNGWWHAEVVQRHKAGHDLHILSSVALLYDEQERPTGVIAVNHGKLAEEALQKAATEIFDLYNNAPCGYHSLNHEGVIVEINHTELRWLGYSRDEVVGKRRLLDFLTPESQLIFHQNFPLFRERGWMEDLQYELIRKNGATFSVLLSSKASYDEQGQFLISHSSVFDITALTYAQQALMESEARYRFLAENVTDTLFKINAVGVRTFVTPSCYKLLGYTPDELIGQDSFAIVHPDDLPGIQDAIQQAFVTGQSSFLVTQRLQHKAGYYYWVESTNSVIRDPSTGDLVEIVSVARNITERKRAETLLQVRMEEEHEFQDYLRALHEITIELTQLEDMDAFYRRTVELGLRYFYLDRLALFIHEPESGLACGLYGTDHQGQVIDERHIRFQPKPNGIFQLAFTSVERFGFRENVQLYHNHQLIGYGWNAATILWNGAERLGWLVADNLLSQKPASKPMLDILRLYALTVGTLLAQKQAQFALRESERRYRLLAENISDVVVETTTAAEFLYVSPSCYVVLGYEPFGLIGQNALDYIHPDDLPLAREVFLATQTTNHSVVRMVVRFRHRDGHYFWLETMIRAIRDESTEKIVKYIGSARNISDRKAAELALQESEQKYRSLVEAMRSGLLVYDAEDKLIYVNDRACEMVGYSRAEMLGTRPYDSPNNQAAQKLKEHLVEKRGQAVAPYEVLAYHQNGTPLYFLISAAPLFDKQGDYSGSLLVITDISVQKQAEETLRLALAKEKELGELKSRFISMASHEFRTPLATILALTETINAYRHKLSDAQIRQRLERIMEQVDHLKDIMEDVLLLAQLQARRAQFNPSKQDLDALCRTLLDEFQGRADVKHQLIYHAAPGDYTIQLDPKLMRQIISNLLSNAIKYSSAEKPVQITLAQHEMQCVLHVRDDGIGIPPADLPHLFEPFHRASNVGTIAGTGLGLVITKEAIELHNGLITVESQLGQGTIFTVHLPLT
ncbi:MAG: PAS domain S-box protein [Caldilineaceae bacterium]